MLKFIKKTSISFILLLFIPLTTFPTENNPVYIYKISSSPIKISTSNTIEEENITEEDNDLNFECINNSMHRINKVEYLDGNLEHYIYLPTNFQEQHIYFWRDPDNNIFIYTYWGVYNTNKNLEEILYNNGLEFHLHSIKKSLIIKKGELISQYENPDYGEINSYYDLCYQEIEYNPEGFPHPY